MHTFNLNSKNTLNIRSHTFYLQSNNLIIRELFRFGGVNSIRGFAENSLQANFITTLLTEYRYIVSPSLYFHTIMDYCKFTNPTQLATSRINTDLFGLGLGIITHSKLLALSIANGSAKSPEVKADNTIVHINYNVKF